MKIQKQQQTDDMPVLQDEKDTEIESWKNKYLRALADYQNLVKRTEEEKRERERFAAEIVIVNLLPVVDTIERTQNHIQNEGLGLALKDIAQFFHSFGVEKIAATGLQFDPYTMDCVDVAHGDDQKVIDVVTPGYTMHGKVIRAAKVIVGKK